MRRGELAVSTGGTQQQAISNMVPVVTTLVIIYAVVGALLVILSALINDLDPALKLTYKDYLEQMAIAAGGLGIGRGLVANAKAHAN